jgi:polyisoprenoid-binding protein YceI
LADLASATEWQVDAAHSRLGFTGIQQGGAFEGEFHRWRARLSFDQQDLAHSYFEVVVEMASVDTGSHERDQYLPGPAWFATRQFPTAVFRSSGFSVRSGADYLVHGELTLRGVTRAVSLPFRWESRGNQARLHLKASVDRTDFGIGQGEFASSDVIGREVHVVADVALFSSDMKP